MTNAAKGPEDEQPRVYAVRLTERARRDLDSAVVWLAGTAGVPATIAWREGFYREAATLAILPRRYPLAPGSFQRETRQLSYRRSSGSSVVYHLFFTIVGEAPDDIEGPRVVILHIRHAASRPMTHKEAREIEASQ